jgi:hypothetical protein
MITKAQLTLEDPLKRRADKLEKEIDPTLAYEWQLYRHRKVAFEFDVKAHDVSIKALAIELQRRYKQAGWKVEIRKLTDAMDNWHGATLEFRGEVE